MSNMSYCRFENTSNDLEDCVEHWNEDEDLSDYEKAGKKAIISSADTMIRFCPRCTEKIMNAKFTNEELAEYFKDKLITDGL